MASPDKLSFQFKSLQIGPLERQLLSEKTIKFAEEHLRKVEEHRIPCFSMKPDKAAGLLNFPIEEGPKNFDSILAVFEDHVLGNGIQHNHGGYVGFVPGGGIYSSALADFLAAVTNRQATCPGAVRMENLLISWVAGLYDFPKGFAGSLTSGGSTATVLAMQTARHSKRLKGRDFERTVVYVTEAVHICVQKALNVIGLFEAIIRKVPMDEEFRMIPSELLRMVRKDKESGLLPSIVVATLGTTNFGSVDPIDEIADVAEEYDLWLHVDAAYGGFFVLVDELQAMFKGVHRSDSLVVDPHKGLFLPLGTGIVIVREGYKLKNASTVDTDALYLQDDDLSDAEPPRNLSFELSRHFRGVRMWLPLQLYGVRTFRECLQEKITLARYFYSKLTELPGFAVGNDPQLTVVTFHYMAKHEQESEKVNRGLLDKIQEDGSVFLTSTKSRGKFLLRVCIMHFRCHRETIDRLLVILQDKVKEVTASQ